MTEELVSIVVPVYNVEEYLPDCLRSIRNQSYRKLQILLVDDGSTDLCPEICDKAASEDERIEVIHKENGGLSDARNAGLEVARGEFVTFVDSDDWLDLDFIRNLYNVCVCTGTEVAVGDYVRTNLTHGKDKNDGLYIQTSCQTLNDPLSDQSGQMHQQAKNQSVQPAQPLIYNRRESLEACYLSQKHGMSFTTWGKLYRTSLWKDHNVTFPVGRINEDAFTTYRVLYYSNRTAYIDKVLYYYRQTEGSIMQKPFSLSRLDGLEAAEGAWKFFHAGKENELAVLSGNYYCRLYFNIYYHMKNSGIYNDQQLKEFQQKMRQDIRICTDECDLPGYKRAVYEWTADHPSELLLKRVMAQ